MWPLVVVVCLSAILTDNLLTACDITIASHMLSGEFSVICMLAPPVPLESNVALTARIHCSVLHICRSPSWVKSKTLPQLSTKFWATPRPRIRFTTFQERVL